MWTWTAGVSHFICKKQINLGCLPCSSCVLYIRDIHSPDDTQSELRWFTLHFMYPHLSTVYQYYSWLWFYVRDCALFKPRGGSGLKMVVWVHNIFGLEAVWALNTFHTHLRVHMHSIFFPKARWWEDSKTSKLEVVRLSHESRELGSGKKINMPGCLSLISSLVFFTSTPCVFWQCISF